MSIPKIFGNKIVWTVIALALILIVIISLINTGKMAFTGFASQNSKKNQDKQNFPPPPLINDTNSKDTNKKGNANDNSFSITVGPSVENSGLSNNLSSENQTSNYTNLSSNPTQQQHRGGGGGHGGGHGGGSGGGSGGNSSNYNNSNYGNLSKGFHYYLHFMNSKKNKLKRLNGTYITNGEEFEGRVRFNLDNQYNEIISAFDINFTEVNISDVNISDISADSDPNSGKAFMHSTSGLLEEIDLYVPVKEGDVAIVICSGASSYDEIYLGCANNSDVTKEELLYLNDPRVEKSSDGIYIVHNITGTGATGVNVTEINSTSQNPPPPGSVDAFAGNITEIAIPQGYGITQAWAGYIGNISGVIQLADGSDNVMYNWTLASPKGEVFASTNNSVVWYNIQCFNFTATGTYTDEAGNGGTTNLYGTNLTQLETQYGIKSDDIDGVDETFTLKGPGTHNIFYLNYNQFDEGECYNTRILDSSGWGVDDHFEEVLLYEPTTFSVVFASLLNEDLLGFDNRPHDFEMLVLENGHGTDTNTTTYYFYAAIS
jgi:hypothetical protein